jgi:arginyl-tRNA synthetase
MWSSDFYISSGSCREIEKLTGGRFDYYCWDLYARVGAWYEEDKSRLDLRARTLHEIEAGEGIAASVAELVSSQIVDCHLNTMARLEITYDLMARESEILHLHFWDAAFTKLRSGGNSLRDRRTQPRLLGNASSGH